MSPIVYEYIGIFSSALAAILLFLFVWRRREKRRYEAIEVAQQVAPWGFEQLARLLSAYAVGNYFGADSVTRVLRELIQELKAGGLTTLLRKVGWKVVKGVFLQNADDRKELKTLLEATEAANEKAPTIEPPVG